VSRRVGHSFGIALAPTQRQATPVHLRERNMLWYNELRVTPATTCQCRGLAVPVDRATMQAALDVVRWRVGGTGCGMQRRVRCWPA
jgi:hypothetical protein